MSTMRTVTLSLAVLAMLVMFAEGADHTVGAPGGSWDLATDMSSWAASQTFTVGDNLIFQYTAQHSVLEVPKADYDSCRIDNAIMADISGDTSISLSSVGKRYFICGSIGHCDQGMKLEVDIVASATPPPASPVSPPPPASTARPPPPASSTPPTPPAKSPKPKPKTTPSTSPSIAPSQSPTAASQSPTSSPTVSLLSPTGSPDQSPQPQPRSNSANNNPLKVNLAVALGFGTMILLAL